MKMNKHLVISTRYVHPSSTTTPHPHTSLNTSTPSGLLCSQTYCPVPKTSPNFSAGEFSKGLFSFFFLKLCSNRENWILKKENREKNLQQKSRLVSLRATFVNSWFFFFELLAFVLPSGWLPCRVSPPSPSESIMYQCQCQRTLHLTVSYNNLNPPTP